MFSLVLLTALISAAPEPAAAPSGLPPDQAVAIIDSKGNLRITQASAPCGYGATPQAEVAVLVKRGDETVAVKVKHTTVILTTVELPAASVEAFTVDGKPIAAEKLATLLAKERTVLVALDGKKVDPFLLELYKEGTIILVPPANTMGRGNGGYHGGNDSPDGYGKPGEPLRHLPVEPKEPESRPKGPRDTDRVPQQQP